MNFKDLPRNDQIRWLSNQGGGGPPPILSDGNTVKWFDYQVNVTKDGSNLVSSWDNIDSIPGLIAGALLQATGTNQPLLNANGILFDGVDNTMKTAPFTLIQPEYIYIVLKHLTWTSTDRFFDGQTSSSGVLTQFGGSPNLQAFAGSSSSSNGNLALNTYGIVRVLFNGASSKLQVNETTPITGNFGAGNMGGFTIGSLAGQVSQFGNIEVKEIILRKVADSDVNSLIIYNYLKDKYSL